jgi:hypothetical protein
MRGISSNGFGFSSSVRPAHAGAVAAVRVSPTSLSLGLSVFQARLAQRSTRDLACLS